MQHEIKKIGIKAYSLKLLKKMGVFEENLYVSAYLPPKEEFYEQLKSSGFKDGDELSCRFSHPSKSVHLPRKICNSFKEAYDFYIENFKEGYTIMIHNLMHAKYAGTITNTDGELVMEFIEGDWNADYSMNIDTAIFKDGISTWYLYTDKRKVPYVINRQVKFKEVEPISEELAEKIFRNIVPKLPLIKELLSKEFNSLELLIDENKRFQALKLHNIESGKKKEFLPAGENIFELKTPHDLKRWDKKTKLLISIPANIDRADALMGVITEIKKYSDEVYISYGILSHPAILLREAGFKVERKISNYRVLKFNYNEK